MAVMAREVRRIPSPIGTLVEVKGLYADDLGARQALRDIGARGLTPQEGDAVMTDDATAINLGFSYRLLGVTYGYRGPGVEYAPGSLVDRYMTIDGIRPVIPEIPQMAIGRTGVIVIFDPNFVRIDRWAVVANDPATMEFVPEDRIVRGYRGKGILDPRTGLVMKLTEEELEILEKLEPEKIRFSYIKDMRDPDRVVSPVRYNTVDRRGAVFNLGTGMLSRVIGIENEN